jgi:hypothetical protein
MSPASFTENVCNCRPPAGFGAMSKPQNVFVIAGIGCRFRSNLGEG